MGSTIDNIESWARKNERRLNAGEVCQMLVERNTLRVNVSLTYLSACVRMSHLLSSASLSNSNTDTQDSVSTKFALVGGTIELNEEVVNFFLRSNLQSGFDELGCNDAVDVGDGLCDTCFVVISFDSA